MGYSKYFEDILEKCNENMENTLPSQQEHSEGKTARRSNVSDAVAAKRFSESKASQNPVPPKAGDQKRISGQTTHLVSAKRFAGPERVTSLRYIDCEYPVLPTSCTGFLSSNPVSFYKEKYRVSKTARGLKPDSAEIRALLGSNNALSVLDICKIITRKYSDSEICLGDLVYFARILHSDKDFERADNTSVKEYKPGNVKKFARDIGTGRFHELPVECFRLKWSFAGGIKNFAVPYSELDVAKNTKKQIAAAIVAEDKHGTAESVARKMLLFYQKHEEPSAYLVLKVFMYLSRLKKVLRWERG